MLLFFSTPCRIASDGEITKGRSPTHPAARERRTNPNYEEVLKVFKGQIVKALLFGGGEAPRRVVADKSDVIVLCSEDEYQFALAAKREPNGVGFPRVDVVETCEPGFGS